MMLATAPATTASIADRIECDSCRRFLSPRYGTRRCLGCRGKGRASAAIIDKAEKAVQGGVVQLLTFARPPYPAGIWRIVVPSASGRESHVVSYRLDTREAVACTCMAGQHGLMCWARLVVEHSMEIADAVRQIETAKAAPKPSKPEMSFDEWREMRQVEAGGRRFSCPEAW